MSILSVTALKTEPEEVRPWTKGCGLWSAENRNGQLVMSLALARALALTCRGEIEELRQSAAT